MLKITRTDSLLKIFSPYSPALPYRARKLSGKWDGDSRRWIFPLDAEPQVRSLYLDVYGEWDDMPVDTVNLLCHVAHAHYEDRAPITLGGRVVAYASGRDSGACTEDGVILISGGFGSGGSRQYWTTTVRPGTIFRLLNVPRMKAEALIAFPEWCESITIETAKSSIDREALIEERARLHARIVEINDLLNR